MSRTYRLLVPAPYLQMLLLSDLEQPLLVPNLGLVPLSRLLPQSTDLELAADLLPVSLGWKRLQGGGEAGGGPRAECKI